MKRWKISYKENVVQDGLPQESRCLEDDGCQKVDEEDDAGDAEFLWSVSCDLMRNLNEVDEWDFSKWKMNGEASQGYFMAEDCCKGIVWFDKVEDARKDKDLSTCVHVDEL